jgi:2-oxoglutarate ferredoxin oxidoreductase subunit beta
MINERMQKLIRAEAFPTPFCPGCGSGILMNAIVRAIAELEIDLDQLLFVSGIGCSAWIPSPHYNADTLHTLHGRPVAFAVGAKLYNPKLKVIVISGDGDLSSIGGNHLIHAARKDIDITVICANNMIYGMTGGQLAATTPLEFRTVTTPKGNAT